MPDRDPRIVGGEGRRHRRRGVAVDEHEVRPLQFQHGGNLPEHGGSHVVQSLPGAHEVQVVGRRDGEEVQHGVQHLPVLRGDADDAGEPSRAATQGGDHGCHLDRLGPGPEDDENPKCLGTRGHPLCPLSKEIVSKVSAYPSSRVKMTKPLGFG